MSTAGRVPALEAEEAAGLHLMRIAMDRGENRRAEIEESFDKALRLLEAATAKGRMGRLRLLAAALRQQASPLFVEERSPHGLADLLNLLLDLV